MNREILFRGKRIDSREWVYGLLTIMWGQYHIIDLDDENTAYPVDSATIGQYTGLPDKNNEKIFEGDILRTREWEGRKEAVVIFESGMFKAHGMSLVTWTINPGIYNCEIIGNIHDNPELLQEVWSKRWND